MLSLRAKTNVGYLFKFEIVRILLLVCFFCAFLFAVFFNFNARAQQTAANANTYSPPAASPTPTPIPIASIISEKEITERRLQEINKIFSEKLPVVSLQTDFSDLTKDFDEREQESNNLLNANPSLETLEKNEDYWDSLSLSLPSRKKRIQRQAAEISAQLNELQKMQAVWELTKKFLESNSLAAGDNNLENPVNTAVSHAVVSNAAVNKKSSVAANRNVNLNANSGANTNAEAANALPSAVSNLTIQLPENLKKQIDEIIERIKQTQDTVRFKFGEIIKLQDQSSNTEKRTDEMLGKIAAARAALLSNLVVRDSPPIWDRESFSPEFGREVENSFSERFAALKNYFSKNRILFLVHFFIVLALILAFHQARRKTRGLVEADPELKNGLLIFEHPLTSALILGLFFGSPIYWQAPDLLDLIFSPFLVISIFFLFLYLIEKPYLPILYAVVALYLVNDLRLLTAPIPILTRIIFLAEMLGGIAFLIWLIRSRRASPDCAVSTPSETIRKIAVLLLFPFVFALLANSLGYVALANVIGKAIVFSLSFGLILYALVRVADSLLIFVFRIPPFSNLGMVKNHRSLVQKKIFKIINWLAVLVWLLVSLAQIYLLNSFLDLLGKILAFEVGSKTISISLEAVVSLVLIIWFSFLLSRFIRFALEQDVYPRVNMASGLPYATSTILHYLLILAGLFLAFASAGIDLTRFTIFVGALGVGVGIGLQNIVENFTSGLILLLERPVKVGDSIQIEQHQGELKQIGLRASIVKTFDGAEIIVPNGQLVTGEVTNWTRSDNRRRLDIRVGAEYDADPEQVIKILEEVGRNHPDIDSEPSPRALFLGFGDSSLDFELRAWTINQGEWLLIKSELALNVYKSLKEAGIKIPFPQRELHLKSIDERLLTNVSLEFKREKSEN
jgi:potassium-dependent mechanosensitive channel